MPQLKFIIPGTQLDAAGATFLCQLRTLMHRNLYSPQYRVDGTSYLGQMVYDQLESFGWLVNGNCLTGAWQHQVLERTFKFEDVLVHKTGMKPCHKLRQSMRWKAYTELADCNRWEFAGETVPEFDETRLNLVR